ncbi:MAG: hypothetical protein U0903_08085 [Planctomycetales bacterium]
MVWGWTEALSPMDWLLISVFLGTIAWALYRPQRLNRAATKQEGEELLQQGLSSREIATRTREAHAELKLHEWERQVDGRMQTRLAVLDQLILDADRKIELLQKTLAELRNGPASHGPGEIVVFPASSHLPAEADSGREKTPPHADAA